jgi:large subunit ribosomal protein L29
MKSTDRLNKLRDLSVEELEGRRQEMSEEDFRLRFQWTMGQAEALMKLRNLRKERARLLTILGERQVAREKAGA